MPPAGALQDVFWVGGRQREGNRKMRLGGDILSSALEGKVDQGMLDISSPIEEIRINVEGGAKVTILWA